MWTDEPSPEEDEARLNVLGLSEMRWTGQGPGDH